jgi:CXXX repeat radical SAM target protein
MRIKKSNSPKKSDNKNITDSSDSGINRRDFLNLVAKAAIPTIAFLSLGNLGNLMAKPNKGNQNLNEGFSKVPNDCGSTCEGTCAGGCADTCSDGCADKCTGGSKSSEKNVPDERTNCGSSCEGTCANGCADT